jgi:hypothetical protein
MNADVELAMEDADLQTAARAITAFSCWSTTALCASMAAAMLRRRAGQMVETEVGLVSAQQRFGFAGSERISACVALVMVDVAHQMGALATTAFSYLSTRDPCASMRVGMLHTGVVA